jgi:hypothetical protein
MLFALLTTTLSACCGTSPTPQVSHSANLTAVCEALPAFDGTTSDDLVDDYLHLASLYKECSLRHSGLVDALQVTP